MKANNAMQIDLWSKSSNEGVARVAVAAFAAQLDPTLEEIGDIKTAVSEAVTNAIVHAYPATLGRIRIRARLYEGQVLEVSVRDWGVGITDVGTGTPPHVHHRRRRAQRHGIYNHGEFYGCAESPLRAGQGDHRGDEAQNRGARHRLPMTEQTREWIHRAQQGDNERLRAPDR